MDNKKLHRHLQYYFRDKCLIDIIYQLNMYGRISCGRQLHQELYVRIREQMYDQIKWELLYGK